MMPGEEPLQIAVEPTADVVNKIIDLLPAVALVNSRSVSKTWKEADSEVWCCEKDPHSGPNISSLHAAPTAPTAEGHLQLLKGMKTQQQVRIQVEQLWPVRLEMVEAAAGGGHFHVLQWLISPQHDWRWDRRVTAAAARGGHLEMLQHLHANGCPWDEETCLYEAEKGHLEVLNYLHASGCAWDEWTCHHAAWKGYMEVLMYLHANGCPWDWWACSQSRCYWDQRYCTTRAL